MPQPPRRFTSPESHQHRARAPSPGDARPARRASRRRRRAATRRPEPDRAVPRVPPPPGYPPSGKAGTSHRTRPTAGYTSRAAPSSTARTATAATSRAHRPAISRVRRLATRVHHPGYQAPPGSHRHLPAPVSPASRVTGLRPDRQQGYGPPAGTQGRTDRPAHPGYPPAGGAAEAVVRRLQGVHRRLGCARSVAADADRQLLQLLVGHSHRIFVSVGFNGWTMWWCIPVLHCPRGRRRLRPAALRCTQARPGQARMADLCRRCLVRADDHRARSRPSSTPGRTPGCWMIWGISLRPVVRGVLRADHHRGADLLHRPRRPGRRRQAAVQGAGSRLIQRPDERPTAANPIGIAAVGCFRPRATVWHRWPPTGRTRRAARLHREGARDP